MKWMMRMAPIVGAAALLATSGMGVAAQEDDAELSTPIYVTWTSGDPTSVTDGSWDDETGELRGFRLDGIPLEASDPRVSGIASVVINGNSEYSDDTHAIIESRTYRIDNDEGAWTGSATYIEAGDISGEEFDPAMIQEASVLFGEGAYEGLIVVGAADYLEADNQGEAVILSISTPPVPDVPDLPAE